MRRTLVRGWLQDAVALLRMDDLYIDSFEIKDGSYRANLAEACDLFG